MQMMNIRVLESPVDWDSIEEIEVNQCSKRGHSNHHTDRLLSVPGWLSR
jgi:hypothetical protein